MPEMKTLNGYEVVDAKAREGIKAVQEAVENIDIPEVDLSNCATKSEIPTKVSQLQNDSKFITREEVPQTDLSGYALKSELPTVPTKVSAFTNDTGYLTTHQDISGKADKVHSHPEYLTEHQDISGKADKNHTHPEYLTEHQSLADYALKSALPTKTSQLTNDNRFITLDEVPKTDLSNYALKASVPTKVSQLENDSKFITLAEVPETDLSDYVTESELNAKGYLTEHQSLAGLATEQYVSNKVNELANDLAVYVDEEAGRVERKIPTKVSQLTNDRGYLTAVPDDYITESDLNSYATQDYVDNKQNVMKVWVNQKGYATEAFVTNKIAEAQLENESDPIDLSGYATKDDISDFITEIPAEYVTETELNRKGYLTQHQSLAGLATEQYVNDAIDAIEIPDPDFTPYAKKTDIPDISGKADKEHTHSQYLTSIPSEYVTESELNAKGYLTQHQSLAGLATTAEVLANSTEIAAVEARVSTLESDASKYLTSVPTEYITETELSNKNYITSSSASASYYPKTSGQANATAIADIKSTYATKTYVDSAVANSGTNVTITGGSVPLQLQANSNNKITDTNTVNLLNSLTGISPLPPCTIAGDPVLCYYYNGSSYELTTMAFYPSDYRLRFYTYKVKKDAYSQWTFVEVLTKEGYLAESR